MGTFRGYLESIAVMPPKSSYTDPDDLMYHSQPELTFIYTPGGDLIADDGHTTHSELVWQDLDYRQKVMGQGANSGQFQRNKMITRNLLGRIGVMDGRRIVAFWNTPLGVFNANIGRCLQALKASGHVDDDTVISAPNLHDTTVGEFLGRGAPASTSNPEAERRADLARQMHLMRGGEKQQAMKTLGVGMTSRSHPWAAELQKIGQMAPGWKLGLTSEDVPH